MIAPPTLPAAFPAALPPQAVLPPPPIPLAASLPTPPIPTPGPLPRTPLTPPAIANTPDKDIFTETPVRYLGYSSEVTMATRTLPLFASRLTLWNPLGWAVALGYGIADTVQKARQKHEETGSSQETLATVGEKLTFHTLATWALPIGLIHGVQKATRAVFKNMGKAPGFWPAAAGLSIIPAIPPLLDPLGEKAAEAAESYLENA